jgi:hypothetical protein
MDMKKLMRYEACPASESNSACGKFLGCMVKGISYIR